MTRTDPERDGTPFQSDDYTRGEEQAAKRFITWANYVLDWGKDDGVCRDPDFEALKRRLLALRPHTMENL